MLLSADKYRQSVDTIYELDVDLPILTAQIKASSTYISDAIDAGTVTLSRRAPTQTGLAALMFDVTDLVLPSPEAINVLSQLRQSFGVCELDIANAQFAVPLEESQPSAFKRQITHTVSDLPE